MEGEEVWKCKNGRKKTIELTKEGTFTIRANSRGHESLVTIDVQFGEEYYVKCGISFGVEESSYLIISQIDESVGHSMYQNVKKDDSNRRKKHIQLF